MFAASLALLSLGSVATAVVYNVTVGGPGKLTFDPEAMAAEPGDVVKFTFKQKNHTATQTSFANVCHPLLDKTTQKPVLDSGFQPVADQATEFPTWEYTVVNKDPVWMFCRQGNHCGQGMVFAINCPFNGTNSFTNFKNSALAFGSAQSSQAAAQSSWAATATSDVYGGQTYAPVYHPTVTQTVALGSQTWTTVYESYANSPDPTPVAAQGTEHRVTVGANGGLTFDPPSIKAAPRDTIIFEFRAKNHTVTQSSFGAPCRKLELTSTTGQKGFDSGFIPVDASATTFPTYNVTVNDVNPIWVYCRQANHCGQGMVFAVSSDETSDRNYTAFAALAKNINGTSNSNSTSQTTNSTGAASTVHASMASVALLVVGGLFVFAL